MSIRILSILYNVFEMYFQYCNTLLLDGLTIIIIIIASIDVDNTLEMYFSATLIISNTNYNNSINARKYDSIFNLLRLHSLYLHMTLYTAILLHTL